MEQSLRWLASKASIPEAINQAKHLRKLFLVYISGQDDESSRLETSTWTDVNVGEAVSKYCVLLHIVQGSIDATNFAAIYPQKSVPCITAIGFNGVLLWINEGYISADNLASSIEKVWLSLQIQETTATVLSAAIASKNSEPAASEMPTNASTDGSSSSTAVLADQGSSSSTAVLADQGSSSSTAVLADQGSCSSTAVPADQGNSSIAVVTLPVIDPKVQLQDAMEIAPIMLNETTDCDCKFEDKNKDLGDKTSSIPVDANELESIGEEQSGGSSFTEARQGSENVAIKEVYSVGDHTPSISEGGKPSGSTINRSIFIGGSQASGVGKSEDSQIGNSEAEEDKRVDTFDHCATIINSSDAQNPIETTVEQPGVLGGGLETSSIDEIKVAQVVKGEAEEVKNVIRSSDVYLNIRLPDGASLQQMFSVTNTLRNVKEYVDEHQGSGVGSYDLAIPYPRKVYTELDLGKPLSELDLYGRQALIVVPHQKGSGYLRGSSSLADQTDSRTIVDAQNGSDGSYFSFSFVKRILSFVNPLSYLGGGASSSSSGEQSEDGMRQHSPSLTLRNNSTQSTSESGRTEGNRKRPAASRFGSNIHTLRHDEDDERFNDRNKFWNGNSTEYGGNDDKK